MIDLNTYPASSEEAHVKIVPVFEAKEIEEMRERVKILNDQQKNEKTFFEIKKTRFMHMSDTHQLHRTFFPSQLPRDISVFIHTGDFAQRFERDLFPPSFDRLFNYNFSKI